ncbi:hypothetical protein MG293_004692 [Ovis ammon polii]|uniref:Uncharacterized protein n=1 Tax=Ovis ammon polii TaxID=230172 RepID=A0AAD4UFW4_OVIAM|nr:hypothetical protein MG293_004692 [Ovis ammon polii]
MNGTISEVNVNQMTSILANGAASRARKLAFLLKDSTAPSEMPMSPNDTPLLCCHCPTGTKTEFHQGRDPLHSTEEPPVVEDAIRLRAQRGDCGICLGRADLRSTVDAGEGKEDQREFSQELPFGMAGGLKWFPHEEITIITTGEQWSTEETNTSVWRHCPQQNSRASQQHTFHISSQNSNKDVQHLEFTDQ